MTLRGKPTKELIFTMNQQQKPSFTSAALQCGGHSNPPVEGDASHGIFTTADGDRFVKTGTSFTKRRRLTSRSTESSTSSFHSLLAGPAPCKTSEYHQLVLENDNVDVWSSVTTWDLDFIRSLDSPQAVFAEVEAYKQRKPQQTTHPVTTTTPFVSAIELALAELPEQTRRLAAWIPAPSPSVVQQRVQGIRRGNVSIKYTRKEKRRIKTNSNRIWRETRRRTHHKVPDDYVFQPKITEAIVEEELEDDNERTINDSYLVDNGGSDDDDNDLATNDGDDDSVLPPTEANDNDDNEDATGDSDDNDGNDTSGGNAVQLGSMYIHDPRYPSHSAVRRSCRVAARRAQQTNR